MAGEFDLISRFLRPLAGPEGLGLLDDAACITPTPGNDLIVTKDLLVEGVHFRPEDAAGSIAQKALAVNLSDLAAKGAAPRFYFLGISLPRGCGEYWLADFAAGLAEAQRAAGVTLAGGDTTYNPDRIVVSITAIGEAGSGAMLRRDGANVGDVVYVSGTVGDAALGLKCLSGTLERNPFLEDRYLHPQPRLLLGRALIGKATACADVSDGLLADLNHICKASGAGMQIERDAVPLSAAATSALEADSDLWQTVLGGGDDYELVFTVPLEERAELEALAHRADTNITAIGQVTGNSGVRLVDLKGQLLQTDISGYDHFA